MMKNKRGIQFFVAALTLMWFLPCFAGTRVQYVYDNLNRLAWEAYEDGSATVYQYDEVGNRLSRRTYQQLIYANYGSAGLWLWDGSTWSQVNTGGAPTNIIASGPTLYAGYAGTLWQWNGSAWTGINTALPNNMLVSGSILYADYGSAGLWSWNGSAWTRINTVPPNNMLVSGSILYADYGSAGLWTWNGSAWTRINTAPPDHMLVSGSILYAGLRRRRPLVVGWQHLDSDQHCLSEQRIGIEYDLVCELRGEALAVERQHLGTDQYSHSE